MTAPTDNRSTGQVELVCLGEVLIDLVPATSGTSLSETETFVRAAGGAPANVAVAAAKLGAASAMLAAVGDDPFGRFLTRELLANGVDVAGMVPVPQQTAVAFVALGPGGERDFMFYRSQAAHDRLTADDVERAFALPALLAAKVLHLGSNSLATESVAAASRRAVELAAERGLAVSFDVNLRLPFWRAAADAKAAIERLLPRADLVKLSLEELEFLTGEASLTGAERFAEGRLAAGARLVCVTLGALGAWYFSRAGAGAVAAPQVESVDTTGAGDAFVAAILTADVADASRWSDASATRGAVARACAYASLSTTQRGAIPSYGDADTLERFVTSTGPAPRGSW